jgi:peptide chain release factor 1
VQHLSAGTKAKTGAGARHTSFVQVNIIDARAAVSVSVDPDDLKWATYRGSGAGGQHRNKTDSAVRVTHRPTGIVVCSEQERSQHQNRAVALTELERRLRERIEHDAGKRLNAARQAQASGSKAWTWNEQRSEVIEHATGKRSRWKDAERGKF